MHQALKDHVFPGAVLLAAKARAVYLHEAYGYANLFTKQKMTTGVVFDLASLTKPMATSLAVMALMRDGCLDLDVQLGDVLKPFKKTSKAAITIQQLLCHQSGLPDYKPYYIKVSQHPVSERQSVLCEHLLKEELVYPIGSRVLYSDLGFMILRWVVEHVAGKRMDRLVEGAIYKPLEISDLFFRPLDKTGAAEKCGRQFAATEQCPWRNAVLEGVVHDENAYAVGGVEGHAGLFGAAQAVHSLLTTLYTVFHTDLETSFVSQDVMRRFWEPCASGVRTPGFDRPSAKGSSSGCYFDPNSIGHLGFTGTSFWMEPLSGIMIILLTNRVHPRRTNNKIKIFRPQLYDMIMKSIKGGDLS